MNRLTQNGITFRLEVFLTTNKGLGVRTLESIPKHHFITEYAGEIISYEEAKKRTAMNTSISKPNYLFVLKEHISNGSILKTHIDASNYGNVARFMNHSCDPNMVMFPVRHNCPVPTLSLFASRNIEAKEELTFSYGDAGVSENCQTDENSKFSFHTLRIKCLCGSSSCAGYLPFDECLYEK